MLRSPSVYRKLTRYSLIIEWIGLTAIVLNLLLMSTLLQSEPYVEVSDTDAYVMYKGERLTFTDEHQVFLSYDKVAFIPLGTVGIINMVIFLVIVLIDLIRQHAQRVLERQELNTVRASDPRPSSPTE